MDSASKINLIDTPEKNTSRTKVFFFTFGKVLFYILIILAILISTFSYQVIFSEKGISPSLKKFSFFSQLSHLTASGEKVLKGEHNDRINILFLGMGGIGHDGPFLTDTIILASFKPSNKKVAMISIPRDLSVYIPDQGWRKINHINSFGELKNRGYGGEFARQIISDILEVPIHYYVRADFEGFKKLIDDLGGLKIYVEKSFIDYEYPAENFKFQTVNFEKGWQVMDGDTALKFARSRHGTNGEGSDFARAARQQKILVVLKDKIFSFGTLLNPKNVVSILDAFQENIKTDLEVWEMIRLAQMGKKISSQEITHHVLDTSPGGLLESTNYEGAYILQPKAGDFSEIQNLAQNIFEYEKKAQTENKVEEKNESQEKNKAQEGKSAVVILNGTTYNGLAAQNSAKLSKKGFIVNKIANADTQNYKRTIIYDLSQEKTNGLDYLETKYSALVSTDEPDWWQKQNFNYPTDFIIILGQDAIPGNQETGN